MANALKWLFQLQDGVSGPAKSMSKEVEKVEKALKDVDKQMKVIDLEQRRNALAKTTDPLKKHRLELQNQRDALRNQAEAMKLANQETGGFGAALGMLAGTAGIVVGVGFAVVSVAESIFSATTALDSFAIKQAAFKQNSLKSLEVMTKSKEAAKELFAEYNTIADITPFDVQDILPAASGLMNSGLNRDETRTTLFAASDLVSLAGGKSSDFAQVVSELQRIKSMDRIDMRELSVLSGNTGGAAGVGPIIDALAKSRRISLDAARKLLQEGKVSGREALQAVIDIAQARNGANPLGTISQEYGLKSFNGQLSTLESNISRLFQDVDLQPLINFLSQINQLLSQDNEVGRALKKSLEDLVNGPIKAFLERYTGDEGLKRLKTDLTEIADIVERIASGLTTIASVSSALITPAIVAADVLTPGESYHVPTAQSVADDLHTTVDDPAVNLERERQVSEHYLIRGRQIRMATGGIATGPTNALIAEAGEPEAVIPLSKLPSLVGRIAGGDGGSAHAEVTIVVQTRGDDSPAVADAVAREVRVVLPTALQSAFEQLALQAGAA